MKTCFGAAAIIFLALLPCHAAGASEGEGLGEGLVAEEIRGLSDSFFTRFNSNDPEGISALFHFPARGSDQEAVRDKYAVIKAFELCFAELGTIEHYHREQPSKTIFNFEITGGGLPCPGTGPAPVPLVFAAGFSRLKTGFVTINWCRTASGWAIGSVAFGVPESDPDAQQVVKGLMKQTMHFVKELSAP